MTPAAALAEAVVPATTPFGLRVETVRDLDAFRRLEPAWNALLDRAEIRNPFLTHEWMLAWLESFGAERSLLTLVVKDGPSVVGIAPLMIGRGSMYGVPVTRIESIQNVYTERFDFLVAGPPEDVYAAIWRHLLGEAPRWDLLELRQLASSSPTIGHLSRLAEASDCLAERWRSGDAPCLPLRGAFESYFTTLDRKHRSNLRNRLGRLGRQGEVSMEVVEDPALVEAALAEGWALEAAAWKGRAGSAVACDPRARALYDAFAAQAARRGWLRLCFLNLSGRRIAFGYVLRFGDRLFLLKTGYEPEYAPFAPFTTLTSLMLRDAFERGAGEFDFLGIDDPWKRSWTRTTRPHDWLFIFRPGLRTRLLRFAKFRLAPRVRSLRRSR